MSVGTLQAIDPPEQSGLREREFRARELIVEKSFRAPLDLNVSQRTKAGVDLERLGAPVSSARIDTRSGRWASIALTTPLVPGSGVGNSLTWQDLGRGVSPESADFETAVANAFRDYLTTNGEALRIDLAELSDSPRVTSHSSGRVAQIYQQREVKGVPVRGSYLSAVVNSGNLIIFGAENWGDIDVSTEPTVGRQEAWAALQSHVEPFTVAGEWNKSALELVPVAIETQAGPAGFGNGYGYRLVRVLRPSFTDDMGSWEALVDAHTGELISFEDQNQYATTREIKGGVYPVTNDGLVPDGVEQAGWPMPYVEVSNGGNSYTTDAGGSLLQCVDGDVTSTLSGRYVNINDNCGAISLTASGNLDFGSSGGTDCVTPGFGGVGNTHASRTGFHELNRIVEMAESHLPGNSWLQEQLTANMNIDNTCNAFWGGGTVNFYRSGGGCFNTGEIAGVFDHEWGHGMDDNDANPSIASPSGEGVADIYAALRLNTSCIGRHFRSTNCTGFGDPCTECTGVRDIDYAKRASGNPHTFTWTNANCGGSVHCVGATYAEAVWDLWQRDLRGAPYNMDDNAAHELVNRLSFIGAGNVGVWFDGSPPLGGCAATSGYKNYLAVDDDNGNLNDGTPHMTAIYNAFNRLEIACNDLTVQDSGCAGTPTTAPVVVATPLDRGVSLTWGSVAGATKYEVFRTDGVFSCDFGKVRVGETTGTFFVDSGLQNGRNYSYVVVPKGPSDSCFGPASACTAVVASPGPNLEIDVASSVVAISTGDGDSFVDNCEEATLTFDIQNIGAGAQSNVRIDDVRVISHPSTTVSSSSVTPSALADCGVVTGSFDFTAGGLSFGDTLTFEVDITSDELSPLVKTRTLTIAKAESDLQFIASKTWDFESDLDGWTVIQGTMSHSTSGGGASGSAGYVNSSIGQGDQCDQVRSPAFLPTATTTVSAWTNYDIENISSGQWWDQANFGLMNDGVRTIVDPDGGRAYTSDGVGASCVTKGGNGWAGPAPTWASSGWSAGALGSTGLAGEVVQLDVAYGTDPAVHPRGFWFDRVTATDIELLISDAQADVCGCLTNLDCDDGVSCTDDTCNLIDGSCGNVVNHSNCDNSLFCDGSESCDAVLDCQAGAPECLAGIETCNETSDICEPTSCTIDENCDDGDLCTGTETCSAGFCQAGTPPSDPVLSGTTISGPVNYQACGDLTVGPSVTISSGSVVLRAGNRVIFIEPVTVDSSAILAVENGAPDP
jgi:hypothetical protein